MATARFSLLRSMLAGTVILAAIAAPVPAQQPPATTGSAPPSAPPSAPSSSTPEVKQVPPAPATDPGPAPQPSATPAPAAPQSRPGPVEVKPSPDTPQRAIEEVKPAEEPKASADASNAREMTLEARPVLLFRGEANWDDGYETLMKAFKSLREEAKRAGIGVVGKPLSAFTETNDLTFKYEAMVFLDKEPDPRLKFRTGMATGQSPAGKAFVFNHVGAYDDIDSVYEAITAWLDEKGLTAKGAFLEEYLNEPQGSDDALLELQIYVFVE